MFADLGPANGLPENVHIGRDDTPAAAVGQLVEYQIEDVPLDHGVETDAAQNDAMAFAGNGFRVGRGAVGGLLGTPCGEFSMLGHSVTIVAPPGQTGFRWLSSTG